MTSVRRIFSSSIIFFIVCLAFGVRLYRISNPIADWHSFRQADTASVTREFVKHGIDLLHPTYQDLSNIQSGKDNFQGYRMVEFPIINAFTAWILVTFGLGAKEVLVGRLVSVFCSLITLLAIYAFGKEVSNKTTGLFAALLFAVLPYAVYYSRTILPEPPFLMFSMVSLVAFVYWVKKRNLGYLLVSAGAFAAALLLKPFGLFVLPVYAVLFFGNKPTVSRFLQAVIAIGMSIVPFVLWRNWITHFPEGIPASDWLFNKNNIRFSGAFFHWLFAVRIPTLILGIWLVVPLVLGIVKRGKDMLVYVTWGICLFAYLAVLAGGNVQHDYYQNMLVPFLCLVTARGMEMLWNFPKTIIAPVIARVGVIVMFAFALFVSWYDVRGYFNVNHWEIVRAGQEADKLLPKDAKVIAPYMGDTAFLYQINRTGWPLGFEIQDKISKGAQYYVSTNYDDETNMLMKQHTVLEETKEFVIIQLKQ